MMLAVFIAFSGPVAGQSAARCPTITDRELRRICEASEQRYWACLQKKAGDPERARCEAAAYDAGSRTCNGMPPGRLSECLVATAIGKADASGRAADASGRAADAAEREAACGAELQRRNADPAFVAKAKSHVATKQIDVRQYGLCNLLRDLTR